MLHVENPYGFGFFTGFLLPQERRILVFCKVSEAGIQLNKYSYQNLAVIFNSQFSILNFQLSIINYPRQLPESGQTTASVLKSKYGF